MCYVQCGYISYTYALVTLQSVFLVVLGGRETQNAVTPVKTGYKPLAMVLLQRRIRNQGAQDTGRDILVDELTQERHREVASKIQ